MGFHGTAVKGFPSPKTKFIDPLIILNACKPQKLLRLIQTLPGLFIFQTK